MKYFIFIFAVLLLISCKEETYKPEGLTLITEEDMIEMIKDRRFPMGDNTVVKNEKGEVITRDSLVKIPNLTEEWMLDMYVNDDFELVEMILRPATEADKKFKERLQEEVQMQGEL